jgi:tetratricopeptide (TPR) repeat protein
VEIQNIKTYFRQGKYEDALQIIDSIDDCEKFIGLSYKALIFCLRGSLPEAALVIDQLWEKLQENHNKKNKFILLTLKNFLHAYQGKEQEVKELCRTAQNELLSLEGLERNNVKEWEIWLYYGRSIFFSFSENYSLSIKDLLTAEKIIETNPLIGGREWISFLLIHSYYRTNQLKDAEKCIDKFKVITSDLNHVFSHYFELHHRAVILMYKKEFHACLENLSINLPIFQKFNFQWLIGGIFNQLAWLYYFIGDFSNAIENSNKSINQMKNIGIYYPFPWYVKIFILRNKGDYESALALTKKFLAICEEKQNLMQICKGLRLLALIFYQKGDFSKALEWAQQGYKHSKALGDNYFQGWCLYTIGIINSQMGNLSESISNLQQALKFVDRLHEEDGIEGGKYYLSGFILSHLSEIYSFQGNFDLALNVMEKALKRVDNQEDTSFFSHLTLYLGSGGSSYKIAKIS